MRLDSVRELKTLLGSSVLDVVGEPTEATDRPGVVARSSAPIVPARPTMALGIARKSRNEYRLAVRLQRRGPEEGPVLDVIRREARGEVDVRYVGRLAKRSAPGMRGRARPLAIGSSIGHHRGAGGTLGCFVLGFDRDRTASTMILSNNHVLALENRGRRGDAVLQPAPVDGGAKVEDRVAGLGRFVRLKGSDANRVDAALAVLDPDVPFEPSGLAGLGGPLAGAGGAFLDDGTPVAKVGRTSGTTLGRVTAFELDNVLVDYSAGNPGLGNLRFDGQVEIEGDGDSPFSLGGDSGSLVVDADRRAVALLFAGGDVGGSNGKGLTYAHPIDVVLRSLRVELYFT